jgi:hypothetical protein
LGKWLKCCLSEFQHAFDNENYQKETYLVTLARNLLNEVGRGTMWYCTWPQLGRSLSYPFVVFNHNTQQRDCLSANCRGTDEIMASASSEKSREPFHWGAGRPLCS